MNEIIYNYIDCLLHPVRNHQAIYTRRTELERMKKGRLFALVDDQFKEKFNLDFVSYALTSWLFVFVSAIYSLVFLHLGLQLSESLIESGYFPGINLSSLFQKKIMLMGLLFEVVFFPLTAWVYVKFWRIIISFFGSIFDKDIDETALDDVVNNSLVGNFFLIIPVFGKLLKQISSVLYIFFGVKHNLRFTTIQSVIVVFSPLLFVAIFMLFIAMYTMLVINLI